MLLRRTRSTTTANHSKHHTHFHPPPLCPSLFAALPATPPHLPHNTAAESLAFRSHTPLPSYFGAIRSWLRGDAASLRSIVSASESRRCQIRSNPNFEWRGAMAIRVGDSLLLSTPGVARGCSLTMANVAVPGVCKHGDQCRAVPRLAILGGFPGFESRVGRHGCRTRMPAFRAAKSGSVDAPDSRPRTSTGSQAQSHLDLLERLTENSTASQGGDVMTIRDQLSSQVEPEAPEVVVSLANGENDTPVVELTISQKRNIRRQNYLNKVSERNDAPFFATVAGFVLVPPILILAFAVATGYVELFP